MSSSIPKLAASPPPPSAYPQPSEKAPQAPAFAKTGEPHPARVASSTALSPTALSSTDVAYVKSLMGVIPAQKMEEILLKTGVPIPVNLGPTVDTKA